MHSFNSQDFIQLLMWLFESRDGLVTQIVDIEKYSRLKKK